MQRYALMLTLLIPIFSLTMQTANSREIEKAKVLILFGPPASGKGTQAERLSKALHLPHISTGDLFRENIKKNSALGIKAKSYIDAGKLVPDELVLEILFDRLAQSDAQSGFILDGVPRTLDQAEAIKSRLSDVGPVVVLNLVVSNETILKRALGRQRTDDSPEIVKQRLQAYEKQTAPLINFYKQQGVLINIDGEKSPDQVFGDILQELSASGSPQE